MAEITHRRSGELMRGVFRLLSAHPEGLPAKTVLEKLVELVPPLISRRQRIRADQTRVDTRRSCGLLLSARSRPGGWSRTKGTGA